MRHVAAVQVTERERRLVRVMAKFLRHYARPGEEARFEAIAEQIQAFDVAYALEAEEWEELNGVPWDASAGIRVLAARGDPEAQAILHGADDSREVPDGRPVRR